MLSIARSDDHPEAGQLRRFYPLGDLDFEFLQGLSRQLSIQSAHPGVRLLSLGDTEDSLLYLLRGSVALKAIDGVTQRMSADEKSARSPIARLRPSRFEVIAETRVDYLVVPASLLNAPPPNTPSTAGIELYEVVEKGAQGPDLAEDQLAFRMYEDLKSNKLLLPSLPNVAIQVGQAIKHDYADAKWVARVVQNDPVIAAKLIKVANSARYAGRASIASLTDAIARIGLTTTHSLVITFALRELFRCSSPTLNRIMREQWEQSRELGAICRVLAAQCGKIEPETALLAGLLHNIGSVAIITHARDYPELTSNTEVLMGVVGHLKSQVGKMILAYWDFPKSLVEAAGDQPLRTHEGPCDTGDLVNVARHHIMAESQQEKPMTNLPAYEKLSVEPSEIHSILQEAQSELQETLSLLNS